MKEDEDKNVIFEINDSKPEKLWPSHMAGVCIADRIEDIKKLGNKDLNLVITVLL
jgi:hypothetical protein